MNAERRKIIDSLKIPLFIVMLMWICWLAETLLNADFELYGLFPRTIGGLGGIFIAPLIHGDIYHLMSNTPAILVLGSLMRYFYPSISKISILLIYLFSGFMVWLFARPYFHIGASGLVYGFAFFLFFSAVFRNDMRSLAISFFVILFYGSLVWGLLPVASEISWETHLAGAVTGVLMAYMGRHADVSVQEVPSEDAPNDNIPDYKEYKKRQHHGSDSSAYNL
jgi:membrane associated rhomboid family serine protease